MAVSDDSLFIGIDIGGTFTDAVAMTGSGRVTTAKVPSTPPHFEQGFFDALADLADQLSTDLDGLLAKTTHLGHGTTVATNVLVERRGAEVGMLATAGHGDAIIMMRGEGRTAGLPPEVIARVHESSKPEPIVPRSRIGEVLERVDSSGRMVVPLDEDHAREVIAALRGRGVESFAIALLWSFKNGEHEQRLRSLVEEVVGDDVFVSCSSELVPRMGEYERMAATMLNAYVGPSTRDYVARVDSGLKERSFERPLLMMQCTGGVADAELITERPLFTFQSGPVGGVTASAFLGTALERRNVITTDVGGTSFDVALVVEGEALATSRTTFSQYSFYLPMVDVRSIGAGGGSIAWFDETTERLSVGPTSAGAVPGPVCYGRGGTEPTVTDAAAVLGYLDPDAFLGGRMPLDVDAARAAVEQLGDRLSMSVEETAAGILRIVEFRMADLLRTMTIERGYDPREFDVLVFGGAGPLHAATYARELGARTAIVPLGAAASVWSALGVASADIVELEERVQIMAAPLDVAQIDRIFRDLESAIRHRLGARNGDVQLTFDRTIDIRYKGQIHEIEIPVAETHVDERLVHEELPRRFSERYEQLYGAAAVLRGTPIETVTFRCRARQPTPKTVFAHLSEGVAEPLRGSRQVYWAELGDYVDTATFAPSNGAFHLDRTPGPCVLHLPITTVVVRPGQWVSTDRIGNIVIELQED